MLNADVVYGFTASLLHSRFDNPVKTPEFHRELWDLCTSDWEKVAIAAPRGHAKSTAVTHSYVLAAVLFREHDHVLIVSDTESQSKLFLGDIKMELTENEDLIAAFHVAKVIKDTETEIIVEFTDGHKFRIFCKGSEQKLRGLKWRNKRPNLIVGDDLENDEIVMNDERRAKFRRWFNNALVPSKAKGGKIRIVGTILHMDAMLERKMPTWGAKTTKTDGIRHWCTKAVGRYGWKSVRYQAHNEDFSKILWPEMKGETELRAIRADYVEDGNPEGYSQEYLNYPIDEENAIFKKDYFPNIQDKEEHVEYYVGVDLAISEKDSRAYSVFTVAGMANNNKLKIINVIRERMDSLEILDTIFLLHQMYEPQAYFIEKENIARSLGPVLDREMNERGIFPNIGEDTYIVPSADKVKRARPMQARARAGGVEVDHDAPWFDNWITEVTQFPRAAFKDQVDSMSMLGLGLAKMVEVPTAQELEDEEWEDEFGDDWMGYASGQDVHMGY